MYEFNYVKTKGYIMHDLGNKTNKQLFRTQKGFPCWLNKNHDRNDKV